MNSPEHSLEKDGEQVQIENTAKSNGTFKISEINGFKMTLESKWKPGSSMNINNDALNRRGIQLDGKDPYIHTPVLKMDDPTKGKTCGSTYSTWVFVNEGGATNRTLFVQEDQSLRISLVDDHVILNVNLSSEIVVLMAPQPIEHEKWTHIAAVVESYQVDEESIGTLITLFKNGVAVRSIQTPAGIVTPYFPIEKLLTTASGDGDPDYSTAISGDTAIIGVPLEDVVYVFKYADEKWTQAEELESDKEQYNSKYGSSVAISGDTAFVGAPYQEKEEKDSGAVYVFRRVDGKWIQIDTLQPDIALEAGSFGISLAISGDTLIIGADGKGALNRSTNSFDPNNNSGAVYIFKNMGGKWKQVQKLQPEDGGATQNFGSSVAIDGDTAMVSATHGEQDVNCTGSVYMLKLEKGKWTLKAELKAKDKSENMYDIDFFGASLAISGNSAIIGSPNCRAAYMFKLDGADLEQMNKLEPTEQEGDVSSFGSSVAISGNTAIVAGTYTTDDDDNNRGTAFVYSLIGDTWEHIKSIEPTNSEGNDSFGSALAMSGDKLIIAETPHDEEDENYEKRIVSASLFSMKRSASFLIGKNFENGSQQLKMADVQIWNKARSEKEIKDSMHLTLTGAESDLSGYWRMGGILPGKPRTVVDFSIHRRNATVHGDAYVSAKTLNRDLSATDKDHKTIHATSYKNNDLFAVSQRAEYVESFEFRIDDDTTKPIKDLFQFNHWGKTSRGADGKIPEHEKDAEEKFLIKPSPFKPVIGEGGWYKASCTFFVPDGVTLMRSFGISKVKGDWKKLHIRKHQIVCLSDHITEENIWDSFTLELLAEDKEPIDAINELDNLEKQEGVLLREYRKKGVLLYGDANWTKHVNSKQSLIDKEKEQLVVAKDGLDFYTTETEYSKLSATFHWTHSFDHWAWTEYDHREEPLKIGTHTPPLRRYEYPDGQDVPKGLKHNYHGGNAKYQVMTDQVMTDSQKKNTELKSGNTDPEHIKKKLTEYEDEVTNLKALITRHEKELSDLKIERKQDKEKLIARRKEIVSELNDLTNQFPPKYTTVLNGVTEARQNAQVMKSLGKDSRTLETTGALLGFVHPSSRLNMLATSEGNVQLSYFDKDNRMRQIDYDATADNRNSRFQQWLPSSLRPCINFNQSQGPLLLQGRHQLVLHGESTIEAWVSFPLTDMTDMSENEENYDKSWRCLAGSEDGKDGYIVTESNPITDQELLGITVDGTFQSSKFDVTILSGGWHHIAAVSTESSTVFYIDGEHVSSYPLAEKLAKAKRMKDAASPKVQTLINARQRLIKARSDNNEKTIKSSKKRVAKLEKKMSVKEKENADKVSAAIKEASAKQPRKKIATLGGAKGKNPFGKVAELRVWSTALPAEEIEINSKTVLNGNEPDLLAYYPMDEASGSEVRDQTGRLHDGTVEGLKWWGCAAPIGKIRKSVRVTQFDGERDFMRFNSAEHMEFGTSTDFTIELWVKLSKEPEGDPCLISNKDWKDDDNPGFALYVDDSKRWNFNIGDGEKTAYLNADKIAMTLGTWHHLAVTVDRDGDTIAYQDGVEIVRDESLKGTIDTDYNICIGQDGTGKYNYWFEGEIADVRIWDVVRTQEEIMTAKSKRFNDGNKEEENLVLYIDMYKKEPFVEGRTSFQDSSKYKNFCTVLGTSIVEDYVLQDPPPDGLVSVEYSTITEDAKTGRKASMMRRCLVYPSKSGITSLPDKRIEELELAWVGNAQFAPTLLGYIEGAPPIPSENLTVKSNYNGATSVKLTSSEDVAFSWDRTSNYGGGARVETFRGSEGETEAGEAIGEAVLEQMEKHKIGFNAWMDSGWKSLKTSHISAKSAIRMSDSLSLRGNQEKLAKFRDLGKRFIPKNVGYALVVSATADVFVTRLLRSKRMIGQSVIPVADIPPDINTITFLINPAYTMAGSLDGLTGSKATSDRFFEHVPGMRAQYGSQYPASFFRIKEAYDLKEQIIREDKRRESYFKNFYSRLTDDLSLDRESNGETEPELIGPNNDDVKSDGKNAKKAQKQRDKEIAAANLLSTSQIAKKKSSEIQTLIADRKKQTKAQGGLNSLQKRMEEIQVRAGKHNIVNNYVWDADGGMRVEAESFANSASFMIGGSSHMDTRIGGVFNMAVGEAVSELTALGTITLTQTMTKTQNHTNGFGLEVDLSGVECRGVTDHDDYPLNPGEKVDRYRFMSYYLEGSTKNFNDFFEYVVDPEWLASNDEEARALRQANGKSNKTWRVLHRVTYVERPALMGFGRDLRPSAKEKSEPTETEKLEKQMKELNKAMDKITNALNSQR